MPRSSAEWWREVLGLVFMTRTEGETFDVWTLRHPLGITVSVMTHQETEHEEFDEPRVGLDHFALQVADRDELERWLEHLDGCTVRNSAIVDAQWGPTVVLRDPDNIQLELFVHPAPRQVAERLGKEGDREHRA